jgi:ferredoxin
MAYVTVDVYRKLGERINRYPQRAPSAKLLYTILKLLFSPEEAELAAIMPLLPFSAARAAKIWKVPEREARRKLERMASKGLLVDILQDSGLRLFVLPPPMVGFFELSLMRIRTDIDQKTLSQLFYEYINLQEDFIKDLFLAGKTSLGRVFVHEPGLPEAHTEILDYEKASHVIQSAGAIAIGMCYCRHKMEHVGRACKAPKMICMTLNNAAASLIRNGIARRIDAIEGMDLLQEAYDYNLVQSGENVQRQVSFICNCCACCCDGLIAARKFGSRLPIQTSNYIPRFDADCCNGCGKCSRVCPAEAIHMQSRAQMGLPRMQPWTNRYALAAGYAYVTVLNKQFIWNQEFKESSPPWMYRVESSKWP